ncbi:hypothetical protein ACEPAF_8932 [Sanghuangporus sanghuang]
MSRLKRALNPKVVEGVMRLPNEPTSYEEFKKAAVKVDRVERQIRDLMAERRRKTISSTTMKPAPTPPLRRFMPPQQAPVLLPPLRSSRCYRSNVWRLRTTHGGDDEPGASYTYLLQVRLRPSRQKGALRGTRPSKGILFEEDEDVDVRAVPAELEELIEGEGFPEDQA